MTTSRRGFLARCAAAVAALALPWRKAEAEAPNCTFVGGAVQSNVCVCLDPIPMALGAAGWSPPTCSRCGKPQRDGWLTQATHPRWNVSGPAEMTEADIEALARKVFETRGHQYAISERGVGYVSPGQIRQMREEYERWAKSPTTLLDPWRL